MRLPFCDDGISCIGGLTPQTPCVASLRRCLDSASVLFQASRPPSSVLCSYTSPPQGQGCGRPPAGQIPTNSQRNPSPRPPHEKRERTNRLSMASKAIPLALAPFLKGPKAPDPHPRPFYAPFPRSRFSSFCQEGRGTTVSGLPIYELRIKPVVQSF